MGIRIAPLAASYEIVSKYNKIATGLLYGSTALSILITALGCFHASALLQTILIIVNSLSIGAFMFFDGRAAYIFTQAEAKRRLDWLDHSFGTNFSGRRSENYFTNDALSPGLYKLAVNCFENSHHTHFICSKMLPTIIVETITIASIFVVSSYFGNREVVRLFFELSLPAVLVQKLIKATIYSARISSVHGRFKDLFNDLLTTDFEKKTPEALRAIMDYEATLAWASIPLKSKIFWIHRDTLAAEWDQLKRDYNIH